MGVAFPSHVINSPDFAPVLSKVFSEYAKVYDLDACERLQPGFGKRVWELIEITRDTEEIYKSFRQKSWFERILG